MGHSAILNYMFCLPIPGSVGRGTCCGEEGAWTPWKPWTPWSPGTPCSPGGPWRWAGRVGGIGMNGWEFGDISVISWSN